jgi:hypothetical protein
MKQRRPKRRKPFRQLPKRLPPTPPPPEQAPEEIEDDEGTVEPLPIAAIPDIRTEVIRAAPYKQMLSWIEVLEALIAELPKQRPGVGHNLQLIADDELQSITKCIIILKHQPVVPTAPDDARAAGSTLKKIGERLGTYLDACLLEASKSAGKELGKRLAQLPYWLAIWYALNNIVQSVAAWLH